MREEKEEEEFHLRFSRGAAVLMVLICHNDSRIYTKRG